MSKNWINNWHEIIEQKSMKMVQKHAMNKRLTLQISQSILKNAKKSNGKNKQKITSEMTKLRSKYSNLGRLSHRNFPHLRITIRPFFFK